MKREKRILVIDNSVDPAVYRPVEHWRTNMTCEVEAYRPADEDVPRDLSRFSHLIVTGSEATVMGDDEWILRTCDLIRELAMEKMPIFGSCFGHQMIVRAISGKQFVRRSPTPEFGWVEVAFRPNHLNDPLLVDLHSPLFTYAVHFDEVYPLPKDWERLATSKRCENAIIKWRHGSVWGVQHHPEIGIEEGAALYSAILDGSPERMEMIKAGYESQPRDSLVTPALMKAFLSVE